MLLPLGDDNTKRTSFPIITLGLIVANLVAFFYEQQDADAVIAQYSIIPSLFFSGGQPITNIFTSMFLHGGWAHLLGNMLYLYIFGDNVEDNLGKGKFLIFYLLCGVAAMFAQTLTSQESTIPFIGASGAIAGVLAGYIILFPRNRVRVLVFFPFILTVRAWLVLGFWILLQLLSEWTLEHNVKAGMQSGGIAYMAHIGGFFAGVVLTLLLRRRSTPSGDTDAFGMTH